jgi:hypothetical protein
VHRFYKTLSGMAAVALMGCVATLGTGPARAQTPPAGSQPAGQPQEPAKKKKAVKDQAEYDLYNGVLTSMNTNPTKALADLDSWKQKYPDSDFKDDRMVYYILAYAKAKEPGKAVDEAGQLLNLDLNAAFDDPKTGPNMIVQALFTTVTSVPQIQNPTPEQLAIGEKAAHMLMDFNRKPEGISEADWDKARVDLQKAAKGTLLYIALKPGLDAMKAKDYPTAEAAFKKALDQFPDSAQAAAQLGGAEIAQQSKDPSKISAGMWEFARAVAMDPAKSDLMTPEARTQYDNYLKKIYTQYHGSEDGLDQLKQQAQASPTPPSDFHIMSTTEVSAKKEAEFEQSNPQLALWMKIKGQLADTNGEQYFESQLKNAAVPQLRGTLVDAKPECHPKELLVAVPLPDAQQPLHAEITLKLDAPLAGKPELNSEFHWEGIPTAFTKDPFMLTMDVEKSKIDGLKDTPCHVAPAPVHHAPVRKKK